MTFWGRFQNYKTANFGDEIVVKIVEITVPCNLKASYPHKPCFQFVFENQLYFKEFKSHYCKIIERDKLIKLKINDDRTSIVFSNENFILDYFSLSTIFLVGIYSFFKKEKQT